MWRPIFRQENLKPGNRLRKELLIDEESLWTEYEVMEADEQGLVLKLLSCSGARQTDNPMSYKEIQYDVLYAGRTRIWVAMEKPCLPV